MTEQAELDLTPRARRRDPATSRDAAQAVRQAAASHRARILAALEAAGTLGATYVELAGATGLPPVAVGRRLHELRRMGAAVRLEATRPTPSGNRAHVHRVAKGGAG